MMERDKKARKRAAAKAKEDSNDNEIQGDFMFNAEFEL